MSGGSVAFLSPSVAGHAKPLEGLRDGTRLRPLRGHLRGEAVDVEVLLCEVQEAGIAAS